MPSAQLLQLFFLFDAFRDRIMAQLVCHRDDIAGDGVLELVVQQRIDELGRLTLAPPE